MFLKPVATIFAFLFILILIATPSAAQAQADNTCAILVSDESGSMEENDRNFIRNLGAKLIISLMDGDRVGIIRFATSAVRLTPQFVTLDSPADKLALLKLLSDTPPKGYTDMLAALYEAAALLQDSDCATSTIVLLSDGAPALDGGLPQGYIEDLLELVRQQNVPIFSIALTTEGESALLYQLAAATDPAGVVIPARSATDLLDAYLEILARLKDRTVAGSGFTSSPGFAPLVLDPALAPYISRATFIIAKPATASSAVTATLVGPGGETLAPSDPHLAFAHEEAFFSVFTVDAPAPGEWGFALSGSGQVQARVILRSRLRIVYERPAAYHPLGQPMPLAASLIEEELDGNITSLIGQASFKVFIQRPDGGQDAIDILYDDGSHGDERAGDGVFTNMYVKTDLAGEYSITFTGYKGLIPATRTVRTVVVPFPKPVTISPIEPTYEFRGQPLPLEMRLKGGDPPALDTGTFLAQVTTPDGQLFELSLAESNGIWSAEFTPTMDGSHSIRFLPQNAAYKGVPYSLRAEKSVDVRLVPAISVVPAQTDLGTVEVEQLLLGLPLRLEVTSSSPQMEHLAFEIVGAPGLFVSDVSPVEVPKGQSATFVTISGDIEPGAYASTLILSAREEIDLNTREVRLTFKVYQPTLIVDDERTDLGEIRVDRQEKGRDVELSVTSTSLRDEEISLVLEGPEGLDIDKEAATILAGEEIELSLTFTGQGMAIGPYTGRLIFEGRPDLDIVPPINNFTLTVVPKPWCAKWCFPLISASVMAMAAIVMGYRHISRRPKPWGSLKPTQGPPGHKLPAFIAIRAGSLSDKVTIGSGRGADIQLMDGQMKSQHAAIRAERRSINEPVGQPPIMVKRIRSVNVVENCGDGLVKVNGVPVLKDQKSPPLSSGMAIVLGKYEFVYEG